MQIYGTDENGEITVVFDSRWKYPELLGYKPCDPEYSILQSLWERATGEKISKDVPNNHRKEGD